MNELKPCECKSFDDVCKLETDNHTLKDYWILHDGYQITIVKHASGEEEKEGVTIPKRQFDALIQWYQKPQQIKAINSNEV